MVATSVLATQLWLPMRLLPIRARSDGQVHEYTPPDLVIVISGSGQLWHWYALALYDIPAIEVSNVITCWPAGQAEHFLAASFVPKKSVSMSTRESEGHTQSP